ncbi:uncharacterized protein EDB91DRAFT_1257535 [Suillus paluster]|uniref:uncharacterized protein n=1 Tax=Suillus paluster TaxID=48578 RepID=UPI001B87ACB4|nr:uncharacterized protein EDB91DRAFT_1257535 [Suillus paluster]KAG1719624.1 hypothetical protein EDB91DRAFT_1257535 [Suillus paluster]
MSLPLLCFLQMNCKDIDFDNVFLSDPSATESSSSPYLTASDNMLIDPAYWNQHPPRFHYLIQQISTLLPALESDLGTQNDNWVADLFVKDVQATTLAKTPIADSAGSITEPESEEIAAPAHTTSAVAVTATATTTIPSADDGSTTEPESDTEFVPPSISTLTAAIKTEVRFTSGPSSTPASTTMPPRLERLDPQSFFATPSPPPPNSIYWKYVMCEEDSKWYDRAGVDDSFTVIRQRKQELQELLDHDE